MERERLNFLLSTRLPSEWSASVQKRFPAGVYPLRSAPAATEDSEGEEVETLGLPGLLVSAVNHLASHFSSEEPADAAGGAGAVGPDVPILTPEELAELFDLCPIEEPITCRPLLVPPASYANVRYWNKPPREFPFHYLMIPDAAANFRAPRVCKLPEPYLKVVMEKTVSAFQQVQALAKTAPEGSYERDLYHHLSTSDQFFQQAAELLACLCRDSVDRSLLTPLLDILPDGAYTSFPCVDMGRSIPLEYCRQRSALEALLSHPRKGKGLRRADNVIDSVIFTRMMRVRTTHDTVEYALQTAAAVSAGSDFANSESHLPAATRSTLCSSALRFAASFQCNWNVLSTLLSEQNVYCSSSDAGILDAAMYDIVVNHVCHEPGRVWTPAAVREVLQQDARSHSFDVHMHAGIHALAGLLLYFRRAVLSDSFCLDPSIEKLLSCGKREGECCWSGFLRACMQEHIWDRRRHVVVAFELRKKAFRELRLAAEAAEADANARAGV